MWRRTLSISSFVVSTCVVVIQPFVWKSLHCCGFLWQQQARQQECNRSGSKHYSESCNGSGSKIWRTVITLCKIHFVKYTSYCLKLRLMTGTRSILVGGNDQVASCDYRAIECVSGWVPRTYSQLGGESTVAMTLPTKLREWVDQKYDWLGAAFCESIELLKADPDKIDWEYLSANPAEIELLEANPDKFRWRRLSYNISEIELLRANPNQIH